MRGQMPSPFSLDANQHSLYWSHGLHLAAIASLNINQKSKWGSAYFPVLGMPIPAALAIQGTEKNLPILGNVIANILVLFDQDIEQAFLHSLKIVNYSLSRFLS